MLSGKACDIQEEVSIGYLEASSWPDYETLILTTIFFKGDIDYHIFLKGLIPNNIFVHIAEN